MVNAKIRQILKPSTALNAQPATLFERAGRRAWLVLVLALIFWAGNVVAARLAVGEISPGVMVCLRWAVVTVVLLLFARDAVRNDWPKLMPHWRAVVLMGMFGYTIYNVLFYTAGVYTSGVNLAILQCSTPVFVVLGARILHRTPLNAIRLIGLALTILGGLLVATKGDLSGLREMQFNVGDLCITVAALFYALYTLALRNRPAVSALGFFSAMAFVAFITSLPVLAIEVAAGAAIWPGPKGIAVMLYVALLPSLAAQLLYMRGVELIGPNRAGLFYNLLPVLGALMAVAILGEPFRIYHGIALALVLTGIFLSERLGAR